jgi:aerobic carbon-monoxide dehydrogenase medium subunit
METKAMAGGQSLGPLLNMRLVRPDLIVDLTALSELRQVERENGRLVIGACITHADIEDGRVPDVTGGALPAVARTIGYRAIRNRGTLGGSLSAADPSADWLSVMSAMGAEVVLRGAGGARILEAADFITGALETALQPGEILEAVRLPVLSPDALWGYYKVSRKTGQHAYAIGAVLLDEARGVFRAVIGGADFRPIVLRDARPLFGGRNDLKAIGMGAVCAKLRESGLTDRIDIQMHATVLARATIEAVSK